MAFAKLWQSSEPRQQTDPVTELRRVRQTVKALAGRAAARATKAASESKQSDESSRNETQSWASLLQQRFFTRQAFHSLKETNAEADLKKEANERARCTFSLLTYIVKLIHGIFQSSKGKPVHIVSTTIADDTDTRLKGLGQDGRPVLRTVCDTVQAVHFRFDQDWESLLVPTPMLVLAAPKTGDIHAATTAHSLVCGAGVGHMLESYGVSESVVQTVDGGWRSEVLVGDALKANQASWRVERAMLQNHREQSDGRLLGINLKCIVHTLNLVRKPMALSIPGYWSTLVRFSHLMESYSFRTGFTAALLRVLQAPGSFQRHLAFLFSHLLNFVQPFQSGFVLKVMVGKFYQNHMFTGYVT
eukprot:Skav208359  [mRNA]  locus=scaffold1964:342073:343149:+ [translate_table: standard]